MGERMDRAKEFEVYQYVKDNVEFMPVVIQALNDGIKEENSKLREQKSKVEAGLVVLCDKVKVRDLDVSFKTTLVDALKNCSFFKMDSLIAKVQGDS